MKRWLVGVLALGVASHVLLHAFSLQLAAAGRRAARLVALHHSKHASVPMPPRYELEPQRDASMAASAGEPVEHGQLRIRGCGAHMDIAEVHGFSRPVERANQRIFSVLIIHEHHLKAIGSDLRLLGVIMQLRSLGHTASVHRSPSTYAVLHVIQSLTAVVFHMAQMLARGKVPPAQRSPPTTELLRLLGSSQKSEALLSASDLPHPPAIYEYVDLPSLSAFAKRAW